MREINIAKKPLWIQTNQYHQKNSYDQCYKQPLCSKIDNAPYHSGWGKGIEIVGQRRLGRQQQVFFILGGKWESKSEDDDEGEVVNELWDVICVIPADEEKVECRNTGCIDRAVATWSSNIDPEDK